MPLPRLRVGLAATVQKQVGQIHKAQSFCVFPFALTAGFCPCGAAPGPFAPVPALCGLWHSRRQERIGARSWVGSAAKSSSEPGPS